MRRVYLSSVREDGSLGRDLDQIKGTNMFGEGRSGAQESARARARAYSSLQLTPPREEKDDDQLTLFDVKEFRLSFLDELQRIQNNEIFPYEGLSIESLLAGINAYKQNNTHSPVPLSVLEEISGMVGRALRSSRPVIAPEVLLGEPVSFIPHTLTRLLQIEEESLWRVAATWLARKRAKWLQERSDPDLPRLRAFEYAVSHDLELQEAQTWWELISWRWGAPPSNIATRTDSANWNSGLVRTYTILLEEVAIATEALARLRNICSLGIDNPKLGLEALGYVAIFDPTHASRILRKRINGAPITPRMAVEGAHRPSLTIGSLGELQLREICRRRGWLLGDIEEPTYIERAMRAIHSEGSPDSPPRRIPDEELQAFAERGDSTGIVSLLQQKVDLEVSTHYVLKIDGMDSMCDHVTRLGRMAAEAILGTSLPVVPNFATALFQRYPRHIINEGTELVLDATGLKLVAC